MPYIHLHYVLQYKAHLYVQYVNDLANQQTHNKLLTVLCNPVFSLLIALCASLCSAIFFILENLIWSVNEISDWKIGSEKSFKKKKKKRGKLDQM